MRETLKRKDVFHKIYIYFRRKSLKLNWKNVKTQFENAKTQFSGYCLAWTGLERHPKKPCFDCAFVKTTLLSVVSKTWPPQKTTPCFHFSPFVSFQRMYYHEPSGQCFELYKRGPCAEGHILSYNYGQLRPQCKCKDHYHLHVDGKCYSLNTEGITRIANHNGN